MSLPLATKGVLAGTRGGPKPSVKHVTASEGKVRIQFNMPCQLAATGADHANWLITGGFCVILAVGFENPDTVVLGTSKQANGRTYTLDIPAAAVQGVLGGLSTATQRTFVGSSQKPSIYTGVRESAISVLVTFSEPMDPTTALDMANYSISPSLAIDAVEQVSAKQFRLLTARQAPATIYTVTVSGVLDLAGNPI